MGQKSEEKEILTIYAPNDSSRVVWARSRRLCPPCHIFSTLEPIIIFKWVKKAKIKKNLL